MISLTRFFKKLFRKGQPLERDSEGFVNIGESFGRAKEFRARYGEIITLEMMESWAARYKELNE